MGVKNLLQYVKDACRRVHIREFRGKTLALDMSCLMHRALHNEDFMEYLWSYIRLFRLNQNIIYMVFDGKPPVTKNDECVMRYNSRQKYLGMAEKILEDIKTLDKSTRMGQEKARELEAEYNKCIMRASGINRNLVNKVKETFKGLKHIHILQAPREADAQLAWLSKNGIVDIVVTDDSDLIVYGCPMIIFKLTSFGWCTLYEKEKLQLCYDWDVFRWTCIMAGCDYMKGGLPGLGLKKAQAFMEEVSCVLFK